MYSKDRAEALQYTISCLRDMPLYGSCQKTLIVDGKIDNIPEEWEAIQVPRINNKFCWGRMWDAGVLSSKYENIVYLDSDRLLPKNFLELVNANIKDDIFIFTSIHLMMKQNLSIEQCKDILENFYFQKELYGVSFEVRHLEPHHGPGKNVMSGSTAFTRKTYLRLGGVDHWYCGHGAFADSDFHMQAAAGGCEFIDLNIPELHYPHRKLDTQNNKLQDKELWLMGLDNFIYYCDKWNIPMVLAESLATQCGVKKPSSYVNKRIKEILNK